VAGLFRIVVSSQQRRKITILDTDPADPGWAPPAALAEHSDVTFAEFNALLTSIHSTAVVGHPAWRFEPRSSRLRYRTRPCARRISAAGRTFTEVANFGGGLIPPLNIGLTFAPGGASATTLAPGDTAELRGLSAGYHLFQCCIHPWMRALIKVESD
jgi:hypothetical protein